MKTGFIVVLFKTPEADIAELKSQIKELRLPDYHIYLIDNSHQNEGFAAGVNKGIVKAMKDGCELVILANPDISMKSSSKLQLSESLLENDSRRFDIWGFSMKQQDKTYYGGKIDSLRMSGGLIETKPSSRFAGCDFVSGSFMCIKTSVIEKIGMLDERFFMYYEDVEYCLRAKNAGFTVGIDSDVEYMHFESSQKNPDKAMYLARNRILFMLKYGNISQKLFETIRLPLTLYEERKVLLNIIRRDRFFVNFFSLNLSSLINKLLFFLLFIFLFRHLGVKQYGIYTLVWAHTAILSPLLDLGTTSYGIIYSPNEPIKKITTLISLRTTISFLVFLLTIILALFFHYDSTIILYIIFTSVIIFSNALSGSYLIVASLLNKAYLTSLVSFCFNLVLVITQIFLLIKFQSLNIIFVSIFIFYGVYTLLNAYLIKKIVPNVSFFQIDVRKWIQIVSKSYIFVLIGLFAGLYYKIDVFLLNFMKGQTDVGIYAAAYKFLEAFLFLPASYNMTATPIYARLKKSNISLLKQRMKRDFLLLTILGFGVSAAVYFIAPIILPVIMNRPIVSSIPVLKIVIFALPFTLISAIFFNTLYVLNKAKFVAVLFIVQTIIVILLNYIFIPHFSYTASAYITVIAEAVNLLVLMTAVWLYLK